jgi:membrane-bound inhibitor of C-type lysozyme
MLNASLDKERAVVMQRRTQLAITLATLVLAACAGFGQKSAQVVYDCADGKQFAITFLPGEAGADIEFERMRFHLRREPTASGKRYACDVMTFTGKGDIADLDIQDRPAFISCRARR